MSELRNLRGRINELESDLRDRDDEVKILKDQQAQHIKHTMNGGHEDSESLRVRKLTFQKLIKLYFFNWYLFNHNFTQPSHTPTMYFKNTKKGHPKRL